MKKFLFLAVVVSMLTAACSKEKDTPIYSPTDYRIAEIRSDNSLQTFSYDNDGRITRWQYSDGQPGNDRTITASFEYDTANRFITISSQETITYLNSSHEPVSATVRAFEEKLYLNEEGTALRAEGTFTETNPASSTVEMMKNYTADFNYDSTDHLTSISISEKTTDTTGWESENSLNWTADLEWADGELTKYTEYINPSRPFITRTYTYYGGDSATYRPVAFMYILRSFYLPLQYQGVLGKNSESLIRKVEIDQSSYGHHTVSYSYDVSVSTHDSFVEKYYENWNGSETVYAISWEPA